LQPQTSALSLFSLPVILLGCWIPASGLPAESPKTFKVLRVGDHEMATYMQTVAIVLCREAFM